MRFVTVILLLLLLNGCTKKQSCHIAEVTNTASACHGWGIIDAGKVYPSENIPLNFQVNGMKVCVSYNTYEDMRLCACCGGTYANILSMTQFR